MPQPVPHTAQPLENAISGLRHGTYMLILRLDAPCTLSIGSLGAHAMPRGWYAYAGSAQGPGGLAARLRRHLVGTARPHWHIDYLRQCAVPDGVWAFEGEAPVEHIWARGLLAMRGAGVVVARFGASDCRCIAHLAHFPTPPDAAAFWTHVGPTMPPGAALSIMSAPEPAHD